MRKVLVIAVREYLAAVRTKAFVISLLVMPLLMGGSFLVQKLMKGFRDVADKKIAVIDRTPDGWAFPAIEKAVAAYNATAIFEPGTERQVKARFVVEKVAAGADLEEAREQLSARVRSGELLGILEVGPDVDALTPAPADKGKPDEKQALSYRTNRPTQDEFSRLAELAVSRAAQERRARDALTPKGISLETAQEVARPVPLVSRGLVARNSQTGQLEEASEGSQVAPILVPFILMLLMYMVIMMGSMPLMQSVIEEKMQRIAEVLLGSVTPFVLMLGKLLGMTAVSLTILAVYLAGAGWAAQHFGFADALSGGLVAWVVAFQMLGSLMFGSLFIAVGAACTDIKETQSLLLPIILLACFPLFLLGAVLQEPNSSVVTALSFFPFATPSLMMARQAVPPGVPLWQPIVGVIGVLLTTLLCVWAAGRIFRVGLLMQGKGARLGEMARWVLRG
jgi:ABC-2 type transport system permease protein